MSERVGMEKVALNLAPGSRTKRLDPRPWQEMADRMRVVGMELPEDGPWEDEPDDIQWTDGPTGYPCWMRRGPAGGWNGYVEVGRNHPLWGLDYTDEKVRDIDVHGGLTFAGSWLEEGDWWFGFDCGHAFDVVPGLHEFPGGRYRSAVYVQFECAVLAIQLFRARLRARSRARS